MNGLMVAWLALAALPDEMEVALGWTKDGSAFVTRLEGTRTAIDARTGKRTPFATRGAFDAWAATHPLAADVAGEEDTASADEPTSPDGKAKLECAGAKREGTTFSGDGYRCVLVRGDVRLPLGRGPLRGKLELFWSPDGRRVAWHLWSSVCDHSLGDWECSLLSNEFALERTAGPRVSVVAFGEAPAQLGKALDALEKAGFTPTQVGPAQKARTATVVYAAKGKEADAKRVAAALGDAKVEPLTWKADADVVVALGE